MRCTRLFSGSIERLVIMVLGVVLAGMLGITSAVYAQTDVSVNSTTAGWQQTPMVLQQGNQFTVSYVSGKWTVDYRNFPYVGPEGYPQSTDNQIYQGCKLDPSIPYATLLGRVGHGAFFPVGRGGTFTADTSGRLFLRIHDDDACLGDNDGSVTVSVR